MEINTDIAVFYAGLAGIAWSVWSTWTYNQKKPLRRIYPESLMLLPPPELPQPQSKPEEEKEISVTAQVFPGLATINEVPVIAKSHRLEYYQPDSGHVIWTGIDNVPPVKNAEPYKRRVVKIKKTARK